MVTANDDPAWKHKREHFDYTLGPGLVYLQQKANADTALMVVGLDRVSSSGRKGTAVVAALFGVSIPLGSSNLVVGMIELESGDLLWTNSEFSYADEDLCKPEDADAPAGRDRIGHGEVAEASDWRAGYRRNSRDVFR